MDLWKLGVLLDMQVQGILKSARQKLAQVKTSACSKASLAASKADARHSEESVDDDDEWMCVVCMELPIQMTLMPCRHSITCSPCTDKILGKSHECPFCRCQIHATTRLEPGQGPALFAAAVKYSSCLLHKQKYLVAMQNRPIPQRPHL